MLVFDGRLLVFVFCAVYFLGFQAETTQFNHTKCPPGWGTRKLTNPNSKCRKCTKGKTYSSQHSNSPCFPCSQCGVGLYKSHRCTPTKDTICSECVSYLDYKNVTNWNDFLEKCGYLFLK